MTAIQPITASTRVDLSLRATSLALALDEAATFTDRLFETPEPVVEYRPIIAGDQVVDIEKPRTLYDADPAELDWR